MKRLQHFEKHNLKEKEKVNAIGFYQIYWELRFDLKDPKVNQKCWLSN